MVERSKTGSRAVILDALEEARLRPEAKIEAEHLLLALSRRSAWGAGRVLLDAGLDHDRLRTVLDESVGRTLAAVGVGSGGVWIPDSTLPVAHHPSWGESAKAALRRAAAVAKEHGNRRLEPAHILIGVLRAREGTVPRALAMAGVDVADLTARAEATLASTR